MTTNKQIEENVETPCSPVALTGAYDILLEHELANEALQNVSES